jgi:hypothetical protein
LQSGNWGTSKRTWAQRSARPSSESRVPTSPSSPAIHHRGSANGNRQSNNHDQRV